METKNPPPMMTEKMPTTKPPTRSSAVSPVTSQGASALIHERSITVLQAWCPRVDSSTRNQKFRTHAFLSECWLSEPYSKSRSQSRVLRKLASHAAEIQ